MANANGAQGGSDFSAQWIQYYRSMGMHREAEFIEQQAKTIKVCSNAFIYLIIKYLILFFFYACNLFLNFFAKIIHTFLLC